MTELASLIKVVYRKSNGRLGFCMMGLNQILDLPNGAIRIYSNGEVPNG